MKLFVNTYKNLTCFLALISATFFAANSGGSVGLGLLQLQGAANKCIVYKSFAIGIDSYPDCLYSFFRLSDYEYNGLVYKPSGIHGDSSVEWALKVVANPPVTVPPHFLTVFLYSSNQSLQIKEAIDSRENTVLVSSDIKNWSIKTINILIGCNIFKNKVVSWGISISFELDEVKNKYPDLFRRTIQAVLKGSSLASNLTLLKLALTPATPPVSLYALPKSFKSASILCLYSKTPLIGFDLSITEPVGNVVVGGGFSIHALPNVHIITCFRREIFSKKDVIDIYPDIWDSAIVPNKDIEVGNVFEGFIASNHSSRFDADFKVTISSFIRCIYKISEVSDAFMEIRVHWKKIWGLSAKKHLVCDPFSYTMVLASAGYILEFF